MLLRSQQGQKLSLYVKTRRRGDWQTTVGHGQPRSQDDDETNYWVFVDLTEERPAYYIVPEWWIENDIFETFQAYLARHGGRRALSPSSTHHGIKTQRIAQWRSRWDLVGLERNE
jgi:hypothetical protein